MLGLTKITYFFKQYPLLFRRNCSLSINQITSRKKFAYKKSFEIKFINTLMRSGNKLKILHLTNKWWINAYRTFYRYQIEHYKSLTTEEILKKYMNKSQFIEFLHKEYYAWNLSDLLYFRLNTLLSMFQLKHYNSKNNIEWGVTYLPPEKRLVFVYGLFVLHFRATRLSSKKLLPAYKDVFSDFLINNDTEQELNDIKLQAYKQFLF